MSWVPTKALNKHFEVISVFFGYYSYITVFTATQSTLKPSNVVYWAAGSISIGYSYTILTYWGIIILMGPVLSIKKQKYQFLGDFSTILLYISVFFTFTSELRVRGNI